MTDEHAVDPVPRMQDRRFPVTTFDGRRLDVHEVTDNVAAPGTPTVVFEAGLASPGDYWALIQPTVGAATRTVSYDRAGLGTSPGDREPRTCARMAADLSALLDAVGDESYLLVAHSGGGPIARMVAADHPDRVVGLVLVDPTDEACESLFDPWFRRVERIAQHGSAALARMGLLRRMYRRHLAALPPDAARRVGTHAFTRAAMATRAREIDGLVAGTTWLRDHPLPASTVPITVISGARAGDGMNARLRAAANASHRVRADTSPRGRHVIAEQSAHMVILTEPELVIAEILGMVSAVSDVGNVDGPADGSTSAG